MTILRISQQILPIDLVCLGDVAFDRVTHLLWFEGRLDLFDPPLTATRLDPGVEKAHRFEVCYQLSDCPFG
jgi:hypothetical protein